MTVLAVALLKHYGVSLSEIASFGAYLALCLALPGVLLIRALYDGSRTLAEEIALGTALGYAIELIVYIGARAAGMPLLVAAWPVVTIAVFLAVPRLRKHWRSASRRERAPVWWSWALALIIGYVVVWSAVNFFRTQALAWPALGASYIDMPFHIALIAELKHHVPPMVPMVAGEPLAYHWFVYAHLAAASWVTGVEPLVLLFRLGMMPMMAALVVLLGMAARCTTRSWKAGLVAVVATVFMVAPYFYLGPNVGVFIWKTAQSWSSPTQTFGAVLFVPIVLLLVQIFERRRLRWGGWLLLGIFLVGVMGAKATYLPLLTAGLLAVAVVEAVRWLRVPWAVLGALVTTAACFLFAQLVLFSGARQGMVVDPLSLMRLTWGELSGVGTTAEGPLVSVLGVTLLCLLSAVIAWSGVLGLLPRPRLLLRPWVVLMLAMTAAGLGVALLYGHPGRSQGYFLQAPYPYLAIVAVYGLLVIVRRARVSWRAVACASAAGMAVAHLVRVLSDVRIPLDPGRSEADLYRPYLALLVVVLTMGVLLALRRGVLRAAALTLVLVTALGTPAAWLSRVLPGTQKGPGNSAEDTARTVAAQAMPQGIVEAGRWLRGHSHPDDLVATNLHCRLGVESSCDNRAAWVAALTERRVLLEGWTYTAKNLDNWHSDQVAWQMPFWDQERLRANDAVFHAPSPEAVRHLRNRYGVRWLFVDERFTGMNPKLGEYARAHYRSGDYAVYELPR